MSAEWHYSLEGQQHGPVSAAELKQMADIGELHVNDLVWREGIPKWLPAHKVKGLFAEGSRSPTPPATQSNAELGDSAGSVSKKGQECYGMPNYDKYAKYTSAQNWKALCKLNNVEFDSFGTKKELKVLPNYLEDGEVVFALTSGVMKPTETSNTFDWGGNTWLVVLSSERFLFLDHAMLTSSVDTQSIRHDRVQAVSASQGWVLGKIMVDLGARTVVIDNCLKATVSAIADLANKWLVVLQKKNEIGPAADGGTGGSSPLDELKKLAQLHSIGALTDDEFTAAKAKLLASM